MVRTRVVVVFEMYWLLPLGTCLLSHFTMSEREKLGDSFDPVLRVHLSYLTNFTLSQFCSPQTMLLSIFFATQGSFPSFLCLCLNPVGIPGQQQSPSHCVHSASNNHGFLFAFSLCVCLQAHKHVLYLCALCMFAGHCLRTNFWPLCIQGAFSCLSFCQS